MAILTNNSGLEVNEDSTRHMFASSSLTEERVERVVSSSNRLVTRHLTIRLDAVLQTVQLPAGVAHLHSGLADMYADALTLLTHAQNQSLTRPTYTHQMLCMISHSLLAHSHTANYLQFTTSYHQYTDRMGNALVKAIARRGFKNTA